MSEENKLPVVQPDNSKLYLARMDAAKKALAKGVAPEKKTYPLRELEVGSSVTSVYWGRKLQGEVVDVKTGEVKERHFIYLTDPQTDEKFKMWENTILHNALVEADVTAGTLVTINRLEKKKTKLSSGPQAGQTVEMNQYEIEVFPL